MHDILAVWFYNRFVVMNCVVEHLLQVPGETFELDVTQQAIECPHNAPINLDLEE